MDATAKGFYFRCILRLSISGYYKHRGRTAGVKCVLFLQLSLATTITLGETPDRHVVLDRVVRNECILPTFFSAIGVGGLLLEDLFNAGEFVDVSVALNDPGVYQDIQQVGETQPDYLMWAEQPQSPYFVVECKGCQSGPVNSFDQLREGA